MYIKHVKTICTCRLSTILKTVFKGLPVKSNYKINTCFNTAFIHIFKTLTVDISPLHAFYCYILELGKLFNTVFNILLRLQEYTNFTCLKYICNVQFREWLFLDLETLKWHEDMKTYIFNLTCINPVSCLISAVETSWFRYGLVTGK